jgi:hypothetical protein
MDTSFVQISRNGIVVATYDREELKAAITHGAIAPTDYWKTDGMTEWKLVSHTPPYISKTDARKDRQKEFEQGLGGEGNLAWKIAMMGKPVDSQSKEPPR